MTKNSIQVENLTKMYKLYDKPSDRLKDSLGFSKKRKLYREHYALRDVSLSVGEGECVGIIGVNGSGKSTLLKMITGVLAPTAGQVRVNGRISALLELGAGFNMEYTGLENIRLNGTMQGFSDKEIEARMQGILDFADIGDFVSQPVKTYSSGMFVRLAFALAINIDPEILVVDEALSVGDVFFQAKCYHKFEEFKRAGKTILFVSHDLSSIAKYCDRVILLHQGAKLAEGSPKEMVDLYKQLLVGQTPVSEIPAKEKEEKESGIQDRPDEKASGTKAKGQENVKAKGQENVKAKGQENTKAKAQENTKAKAQESQKADAAEAAGAKGAVAAVKGDAEAAGAAAKAAGEEEKPCDGPACDFAPAQPAGYGAAGEKEVPSEETSEGREETSEELLDTGSLPRNPQTLEYGNGKARMIKLEVIDDRGRCSNAIEKGSSFAIRVTVRFKEDIQEPIVAYTFKNIKGTEITGTNTMFEKAPPILGKAGSRVEVTFTQQMNLQGGEYLLSLGCTGYQNGEFTVFHRLYDVVNISVISDKNTVGFFDMNSKISILP